MNSQRAAIANAGAHDNQALVQDNQVPPLESFRLVIMYRLFLHDDRCIDKEIFSQFGQSHDITS